MLSIHEKEALFRALNDPFHPLEFKRRVFRSMNINSSALVHLILVEQSQNDLGSLLSSVRRLQLVLCTSGAAASFFMERSHTMDT